MMDCVDARTSARGLLSLTNAVWRFESGLFKGFSSEYKRQEQQASENNHRIKFFSGEMVYEKIAVALNTITKTRPNVAVVPNVGKKTKL